MSVIDGRERFKIRGEMSFGLGWARYIHKRTCGVEASRCGAAGDTEGARRWLRAATESLPTSVSHGPPIAIADRRPGGSD